jgi:hypothetical protein
MWRKDIHTIGLVVCRLTHVVPLSGSLACDEEFGEGVVCGGEGGEGAEGEEGRLHVYFTVGGVLGCVKMESREVQHRVYIQVLASLPTASSPTLI